VTNPRFSFDSARELYAKLTPAPTEAPQVTAIRRMVAGAAPEDRDAAAAAAIQSLTDDDDPELVGLMAQAAYEEMERPAPGSQPTREDEAAAGHERQRQAIVAAGAEPTRYGSGGYGIADVSIDALTADGRTVFETAQTRGVDEIEAFRLARKYESETGQEAETVEQG
jgi:hypothetical protein